MSQVFLSTRREDKGNITGRGTRIFLPYSKQRKRLQQFVIRWTTIYLTTNLLAFSPSIELLSSEGTLLPLLPKRDEEVHITKVKSQYFSNPKRLFFEIPISCTSMVISEKSSSSILAQQLCNHCHYQVPSLHF